MKGQISIIIFALFMWSVFFTHCMATDDSLRTTLENKWEQYLKASQSGVESDLAKVMSSYRLVTMKNNLASANRSLTLEMVKGIAQYAPNINSAEFFELIEKGPTVGLVYLANIDENDVSGEERVNFIFIKFVKEESGWKVDGGMEIGSPKFKEDGTKSVLDPSTLPPTFEIDGKILSTPTLIKIPDVAGLIDIFSAGYSIKVSVNGIEVAEANNSSYSGIIKGGLNKRNNSVIISVSEETNDLSFNPTVTISQVLVDKNIIEVFKFKPKENIVGKHEFEFKIDDK